MRIQAHSWIRNLAPYEPGRPIEEVARELGLPAGTEILKLAANENALGPSPLAVRAMRACLSRMHRYPDTDAYPLRQALSARLHVAPGQLIFGHGSNELLAHMGYAFLDAESEIVVADRAFVIYRMIADLYRARTVSVPMRNLTHDLEAMAEAVTPRTRMVFVANPNNPTGTTVEPADLDRFVSRMPDSVVVVLDEAYVELLDPARQPDTLRWVREGRPVFVLRTFSKTYGLAGLRIGYAVGPEEGIQALDRIRPPFNVNAMAQEAALAALADEAHVERTRRMVARGLRQLERGLRTLGVEYTPSVANFMLVQTGDGRGVFRALQRRGIIVRPMDGYGMPDRIRVTVGTPRENRGFLAALEAVLAGEKTP